MIVALTGITGNMGQATLEELVKIDEIDKLRFLVRPNNKRFEKLVKKFKKYKDKFEVVEGDVKDKSACKKLVEGADYCIALGAVIPPKSDQNPQLAIDCNELGAGNLVSAIEECKLQPKYVHISTVALYGNRNHKHIWGRVGDPLLVSPFDIYSATKLRGEFRVLESEIKNWAVIRQTAMLHGNMLTDNMSDGLMFHTCFDAPLEWLTAHDSGVLIANILKSDIKKGLGDKFWGNVFNIGGGIENCVTGYDTLNAGFELIGGGGKDFFRPNNNAIRNFHGVWFLDSDKLDKLVGYRSQTCKDFWKEYAKNHRYFSLAKILPKSLIRKCAIERLFKNYNSPKSWIKNGDEAKEIAYFGKDKFKELPTEWKNFKLLCESEDFKNLKNSKKAPKLDYGFNIDGEITLKDCQNVAKMHGGKLISKKYAGAYQKLEWETQDGERFFAKPFTVLKAGHWMNPIYKENVWDFDRLSKKDKIFAQIWYDSHDNDEDYRYWLDKNFVAKCEKLK
jgi:nucleoside-diphosphate-sugar epimerase